MSTDTIVVADTETTGLDPAEGAALLEIAFVVLALPDGGDSPDEQAWTPVHGVSSFIEYEGDIPAEARAVHHIRPDQVRPGAPDCVARDVMVGQMLQAETDELMYAFHNAPFDRKFLPDLRRPIIDTLQCARHIWPDAPKHSNQFLRYWLGVEPRGDFLEEAGEVSTVVMIDGAPHRKRVQGLVPLAPHRALYDSACTAEILVSMLADHSPEELVRLSTMPVLLKTCGFGKHRGTPWAEVPRDYLSWMMRSSDMLRDDENLAHTVRHYLG